MPFNISSYALLTHLIAHVTELEVGDFVYTLGDYHIYKNHLEQVEQLLSREPLPLPELKINDPEQQVARARRFVSGQVRTLESDRLQITRQDRRTSRGLKNDDHRHRSSRSKRCNRQRWQAPVALFCRT